MIGQSNANLNTRLLGLNVQTSLFGLPIPIVLGCQRVPGNTISFFNWQSSPVNNGGKFSGKGSSKSGSGQQYNYFMGAQVALCLGPIVGIGQIWENKTLLVVSTQQTTYTVPGGGGTFNPTNGTNNQAFSSDVGVFKVSPYSVYANDPFSPGPITLTGNQNIAATPVPSSPGAGQYTVDSSGNYTFSGSDAGTVYYINYTFVQGNPTAPGQLPVDKLTITLFNGTLGQGVWSGISGYGVAQVGYSEIAYVASTKWELGTSGTMPNYSYEVLGPLQYGGGIQDCSVTDVIDFVLTNRNCAAINPALIDSSLTSIVEAYCLANNLFISPLMDQQQTYSDYLKEYLLVANAEIISSEGKLKFGCYSEQTAVGNGVTYVPPTQPLFDLTLDQFIVKGEKDFPITFSYDAPMDVQNRMSIEWTDRSNQYNYSTLQVEDFASVETYGPNTVAAVTAHSICTQTVASQVINVQLKRGCYMLRKCKFSLGWWAAILEPMDVVTIPEQYPSENRLAVRLLTIEEDDDGNLAIEAEILLYGISAPTLHPSQTTGGYTPGFNADPGFVNAPIFFEAPPGLTQTIGLTLMIGLCGGSPNWGGCSVWVSNDGGNNYVLLGQVVARATMGILSAPYAYSTDPDTTNVCSVDLRTSLGTLSSVQQSDADAFKQLAVIDQELISFEYATATATNQYNLDNGGSPNLIYTRRGCYGTDITLHATGAPFLALDGNQFEYDYQQSDVGQIKYFKFTSFNLAGQNQQDISTVTAYQYTISANRPPWPIHALEAVTTPSAAGVPDPIWGTYSSFSVQQTYNVDAAGSQIASFGISFAQPNNTPSAATVPPSITAITTATTGGSLSPGVYLVAATAHGSDGLETNLSAPQTITIPTGTSTNKITLTIALANSGDSVAYGYVAESPTVPAEGWEQCALVADSSNWDIQAISGASPGAPDPVYDYAVMEARIEYHGGIWANQVNVVGTTTYGGHTVTTLQFLTSTWTTNQLAGRALTLLTKEDNSAVPLLDATIVANTADTITISLHYASAIVGDVWMIRAYGNIGSSTTIGDSLFINGGSGQAGTGLAVNAEIGRLAWIIAGPHAGNMRTIASNTATTLTVSPSWGFTPSASDIFCVVDVGLVNMQPTSAIPTQQSPIVMANFPVANSIGATYMLHLISSGSNAGNLCPVEVCPIREIYQPGGGLNQKSVTAATYNVGVTDQILSLQPGNSVVNLLPLNDVTRHPLWLINNTGSNVTVNTTGSGDTIEGLTSYNLGNGGRIQVFPNS